MIVTHFEHLYENVYYVWLENGQQGRMRGDGEGLWFEHTFQPEEEYIPGTGEGL